MLLSHSLWSYREKTESFENNEHVFHATCLFSPKTGDKTVQMIGLDVQQAYIKSSHANIPARRLNLRCIRKIRSGLSINSSCWSNNSVFSRLHHWEIVISKSKKLPSSCEVPFFLCKLELVVSGITWSNFQDKTFIYLHRY